jgi:transposase/DNA-directed RNA polymerase subunit RPC12/RpoP
MKRAVLQGFIDEGLSLERIALRLGVHHSTVANRLEEHGLTAVGAERFAPKGGIAHATLEQLVDEGMTMREIGARLGRSISSVRDALAKHGLQTTRASRARIPPDDRSKHVDRICARHGPTQYVKDRPHGHYRCVQCRSERVADRRRRVKEILVAEAGARCRICGYDRFVGALQFHHVDPAAKEFGLSLGGVTRSLDRARAEAQKCVLLCSNCHAEVEAGMASLR